MGHPVTEPFISSRVRIPTEKVGCHFVTKKLQSYLDKYPPKSIPQSFKDIKQMKEGPDAYLNMFPRQYVKCMSLDSEFVTLVNHAI